MERVWVTGAKGFIGRHLALHLSRAGSTVYGIGHGLWPKLDSSAWGLAGWVNGDVKATNLESLKRLAGTPSRIFHVAGGSSVSASIANPLEDFSRTVSTTARLLDWVRTEAPNARVTALSSAAVYGSRYREAIAEESPPLPVSPYGYHKLLMEQLCRSYVDTYGLHCTVVRLFSVYGPWLRKQLLWDLCSKLSEGTDVLRLGGSGRELRDWTDVRDVVRLLDLISSIRTNGLLVANGGAGVGTSVATVAALLTEAWGSSAVIQFGRDERPGDPFSLVSRSSSLTDHGFRWEIALNLGIQDYVRWFKQHRR
jgi:UDP-glucose 4-epimerase